MGLPRLRRRARGIGSGRVGRPERRPAGRGRSVGAEGGHDLLPTRRRGELRDRDRPGVLGGKRVGWGSDRDDTRVGQQLLTGVSVARGLVERVGDELLHGIHGIGSLDSLPEPGRLHGLGNSRNPDGLRVVGHHRVDHVDRHRGRRSGGLRRWSGHGFDQALGHRPEVARHTA